VSLRSSFAVDSETHLTPGGSPGFCLGALLLLSACISAPEASRQRVLVLDRQWAAVLEGDSTRLAATAFGPPPRSDTLRNPAITWTSSNPAVAQIDQTGLVRARGIGFALITAAFETSSAVAGIVVTPAVLVGAGDIASCSFDDDEATARLLDSIPGVVFAAGDDAYQSGTAAEFANCYEPTWGRHKPRTRPAPGNHEYNSGGGAYYSYFGRLAGDSSVGYYSYDVAGWHIISLNSNVAMAAGSPQEQWLRADLAAHPAACTLAYWHHPRFSSGTTHGSSTAVQPLWQALYDAHAEVVIAGHEHQYERFAPQRPDGTADPTNGIRQFVVGTGGAAFYPFGPAIANSEVRDNTTHGVIKLTLHPNGYDWEFVPVAGGTFRDAGTGSCH
jgi:hypothetical protein